MTTPTSGTPYHPCWYRPRVSVWWWFEKWSYTRFVLRELTSVAVAYFALVCLWKLRALGAGPDAYARFLAQMKSPVFLFLNSAAFLAVLFHAVTWFNLAPKAMVLRVGGKRLPDAAVQGMNYAAWVVLSAVVAWLALRG